VNQKNNDYIERIIAMRIKYSYWLSCVTSCNPLIGAPNNYDSYKLLFLGGCNMMKRTNNYGYYNYNNGYNYNDGFYKTMYEQQMKREETKQGLRLGYMIIMTAAGLVAALTKK
jgi:hypothetical protein